ncbi:cytochrome b561 and DOMON domain-containing protein At3g61750-like isoform X3 [Musa acuminata AAA Group]|uniref:cytochrome b561 and DOMON domain-containing protein At3g61750-like isoform X3 n=1 Tax=Musa acuminata AAA Group TaxID=214697 RepID=UPI0031E0BDCC
MLSTDRIYSFLLQTSGSERAIMFSGYHHHRHRPPPDAIIPHPPPHNLPLQATAHLPPSFPFFHVFAELFLHLHLQSPQSQTAIQMLRGAYLSLLLAWGAMSMTVHSQVDSCSSSFLSFLPLPFNASQLNCRPVWRNFILRYSQNRDNTLSIILSAVYTSGWVGIGFSSDGMMTGASAMVGWIDIGGRANIRQFYLRGQTSSEVMVDEGQLLETGVAPAVILYGNNIYLAFQLNVSAPMAQQLLLFALSTATPVEFYLMEHDDKASVSFDFSVGTVAEPSSYPNQLKRNHGALGILGWGVLLPVGAVVARYCRLWDPMWYYLHVIIQFVGFLAGFAGVVAGIALHRRLHSDVALHRGLGIFILVLGILQVTAFFLRPGKGSKIRKHWNWYHHWVGSLVVFLAAINIALGIQVGEAGNSWKIGYGIILAIISIAVALLESMRWWSRLSEKTEPPAF